MQLPASEFPTAGRGEEGSDLDLHPDHPAIGQDVTVDIEHVDVEHEPAALDALEGGGRCHLAPDRGRLEMIEVHAHHDGGTTVSETDVVAWSVEAFDRGLLAPLDQPGAGQNRDFTGPDGHRRVLIADRAHRTRLRSRFDLHLDTIRPTRAPNDDPLRQRTHTAPGVRGGP